MSEDTPHTKSAESWSHPVFYQAQAMTDHLTTAFPTANNTNPSISCTTDESTMPSSEMHGEESRHASAPNASQIPPVEARDDAPISDMPQNETTTASNSLRSNRVDPGPASGVTALHGSFNTGNNSSVGSEFIAERAPFLVNANLEGNSNAAGEITKELLLYLFSHAKDFMVDAWSTQTTRHLLSFLELMEQVKREKGTWENVSFSSFSKELEKVMKELLHHRAEKLKEAQGSTETVRKVVREEIVEAFKTNGVRVDSSSRTEATTSPSTISEAKAAPASAATDEKSPRDDSPEPAGNTADAISKAVQAAIVNALAPLVSKIDNLQSDITNIKDEVKALREDSQTNETVEDLSEVIKTVGSDHTNAIKLTHDAVSALDKQLKDVKSSLTEKVAKLEDVVKREAADIKAAVKQDKIVPRDAIKQDFEAAVSEGRDELKAIVEQRTSDVTNTLKEELIKAQKTTKKEAIKVKGYLAKRMATSQAVVKQGIYARMEAVKKLLEPPREYGKTREHPIQAALDDLLVIKNAVTRTDAEIKQAKHGISTQMEQFNVSLRYAGAEIVKPTVEAIAKQAKKYLEAAGKLVVDGARAQVAESAKANNTVYESHSESMLYSVQDIDTNMKKVAEDRKSELSRLEYANDKLISNFERCEDLMKSAGEAIEGVRKKQMDVQCQSAYNSFDAGNLKMDMRELSDTIHQRRSVKEDDLTNLIVDVAQRSSAQATHALGQALDNIVPQLVEVIGQAILEKLTLNLSTKSSPDAQESGFAAAEDAPMAGEEVDDTSLQNKPVRQFSETMLSISININGVPWLHQRFSCSLKEGMTVHKLQNRMKPALAQAIGEQGTDPATLALRYMRLEENDQQNVGSAVIDLNERAKSNEVYHDWVTRNASTSTSGILQVDLGLVSTEESG